MKSSSTRNNTVARQAKGTYPSSGSIKSGIDVDTLERQKRILYDLLQRLRVKEPGDTDDMSDPLQELWGLIEICEDLLDAAEAKSTQRSTDGVV